MSTPWLSIIIPTTGRPTLERLLRAIRRQSPETETEILCVGDTHAGTWAPTLAPVPALCARWDARYLEHDGGKHQVGQPQRNYGQTQATGEWLLWSQDDNLYEPEALRQVQTCARQRRSPLLFRVATQWGFTVWQHQVFELGNLDADCLAVPNEPARLGTWADAYEGDYAMIRETCERWGWSHWWVDCLIVRARPTPDQDWTVEA